jgi:pimeloyl-ACP methyl ester carboxylesterase/predicted glycosyltransferase
MIETSDRVGRTYTGSPAREPDAQGTVERDGVRIHWESYGSGDPAILLMPTWSIVHSRHWKGQIAYLARHFRVVTFDGRGNGLSDRPLDVAAYPDAQYIQDAVDVLDHLGIESVIAAGLSCGGRFTLNLAGTHPDRVLGAFVIAPQVSHLSDRHPWRKQYSFDEPLDTDEGWAKSNRHYWRRDWPGYVEFFCSQMFIEPHSTKQMEDMVAWGCDTSAEVMELTECDLGYESSYEGAVDFVSKVRCPVLVIHSPDDLVTPFERGQRVAEITGGELVTFEGSGHCPQAREPVRVNLLLREFAEKVAGKQSPPRSWRRAALRPKRALFVSSPIGLGHAWRDVAIADELRRRSPGLEIEWLAQHPVTQVLAARGETIHPASAELASESDHVDRESGEHDLHAFQAIRRMDEIFCANFMLFHDLVKEEQYDLWIGDEAWEIDHFLHENPELKTAPFAWLTDFVGFLPMPDGGDHEAFLAADHNAEVLEHVERYPSIRDRSIFIGDPDDIVPGTFGAGLPEIRPWTEAHYDFAGYVPGFDPGALPEDRRALRAELGYHPDEPLCIVSVGGSGVGEPLLQRVIDALPAARERVPGLRMVAVAGPRIDPDTLPQVDGLEVRGYVHELYKHLAACHVAVVQGGLTTCMELVAAQRPFVSLPLAHHFEQRFHVRHRLDRHGARDWLDYADATPDALAEAIAGAMSSEVRYRQLPRDGAAKAARLIAELL